MYFNCLQNVEGRKFFESVGVGVGVGEHVSTKESSKLAQLVDIFSIEFRLCLATISVATSQCKQSAIIEFRTGTELALDQELA